MPAVALEAVDLVALCGILLLIGLLTTVSYTFTKLADVIDVGILGAHPFRGVANAIESTIVAGCNTGIRALGSVAHDLWVGAKWSFNEVIQALMFVPNGVHAALQHLWKNAVPGLVKAYIAVLSKEINALAAGVTNLTSELGTDILRLDTKIENTATATFNSATQVIDSKVKQVEVDLTHGLNAIRASIEADIRSAVGTAEQTGTAALDKIRDAENAAIDSLKQAEGATAVELRNLAGQIPFTGIAAVIASVPLLQAAVNTLESEAGLTRPECRAKVKGICGVDPSAWAGLLEGLAIMAAGISLAEIFTLAEDAAKTALPVVEKLVREAA
jgi:hypothetical protein